MKTLHAAMRENERLMSLLPTECVTEISKTVERLAPSLDSAAVLAFQLPKIANDSTLPFHLRPESNGDQVWAIVRHGDIVTWMLRRSLQKQTAESMRVSQILKI